MWALHIVVGVCRAHISSIFALPAQKDPDQDSDYGDGRYAAHDAAYDGSYGCTGTVTGGGGVGVGVGVGIGVGMYGRDDGGGARLLRG